jgi:hypothetical protein
MTTIILMVVMSFFVSLTAINWTSAQEEELVIESADVFGKKQRPAVVFKHELHFDAFPDCIECHHIYEKNNGEKENVWSGEEQSCSDCHKRVKEDNRLPLMEAFHNNCTKCHREMAKEKKKAGPVTCGECHVRKK